MRFAVSLLLAGLLRGEALQGEIAGRVVSSGTLEPVPGAMLVLDGTEFGAIADGDGRYTIQGVPPGSYGLRVSSVGHEPGMRTDVIVRSGRLTGVDFRLEPAPAGASVVTVVPTVFSSDEPGNGSRQDFSGEEVRRSPGSAGDVVRIVAGLPSVARVDNQYNGLAVRGGNPMENGVYVDNMSLENVNHFPRQSTSGGGLSMVNVDLLSDVFFSAGGFPGRYGDRLSSIMELELRPGNRREFAGQADFGMAGAGVVLEGPLQGGSGSWLAAARHSWVSLLVDIADVDAVPVYTDFCARCELSPSRANRLTFLGMGAVDRVDYTRDQAMEDGNPNYGITEAENLLTGVNWRWLWPGEGFSETSLSFTRVAYRGDYRKTVSDQLEADQDSRERSVRLRNVNRWNPSPQTGLEFGLDGEYGFDRYDNFYGADSTWGGDPLPPLEVAGDFNGFAAGAWCALTRTLLPGLEANLGVRGDRRPAGRLLFSPRGGLVLDAGVAGSFSLAGGVYRQGLPGELAARSAEFEKLPDPCAEHLVLGWRRLLDRDSRLSVEAYLKRYSRFPYDPGQPGYFILDGLSSEQDLYTFDSLTAGAEARSRGVEVILQRRLAMGLYGIASCAWSTADYRSPGQPWRPRIFDNRVIVGLEGGFKFDERWEVSARWDFAGGRPFTPLDLEASAAANRTVLDDSRINAERLPPYHTLNLRADRRFDFRDSALTAYASVSNVYNRRNVAAVYWNGADRTEDTILQWGIMPSVGLEYEF